MDKPMISVAGIRGIVGESLRAEEFFKYVQAFATLMEGKSVVVGGDTRLSRDMMRHLAFAALSAAGCDVTDLGLVPTPTVGLMILEQKAAGGIAITASHNPANWNAYKFFGPHGSFLSPESNRELMEIADSGAFRRAKYDTLGKIIPCEDAIAIHTEKILGQINPEAIRRKNYKVVVDCVNGVGGLITGPLLEILGCDVTLINDDINREFAHVPEPLPENLGQLCEAVVSVGADVGFAIDPDADRLALVDETGRPIGEERTLPICMAYALKRAADLDIPPGNVVVNLSSTRALDDVAQAAGAGIIRTPIGEAHVVSAIMEQKAIIGGEGNGGVIFPAVHCGRDASTGVALVLSAMADSGLPLSKLNETIPDYAMVKLRHEGGIKDRDSLLEKLRATFPTAGEFVTIDGVKVVFADRWVHVRPSGTEPIVRVFSEAPSKDAARALADKAMELLKSL